MKWVHLDLMDPPAGRENVVNQANLASQVLRVLPAFQEPTVVTVHLGRQDSRVRKASVVIRVIKDQWVPWVRRANRETAFPVRRARRVNLGQPA